MRKQYIKCTSNFNNDAYAIVSELISKEKPIRTSIERHNMLHYIQSMAKELSELSSKADNSLLTYLLRVTAQEARRAKWTTIREVSTS